MMSEERRERRITFYKMKLKDWNLARKFSAVLRKKREMELGNTESLKIKLAVTKRACISAQVACYCQVSCKCWCLPHQHILIQERVKNCDCFQTEINIDTSPELLKNMHFSTVLVWREVDSYVLKQTSCVIPFRHSVTGIVCLWIQAVKVQSLMMTSVCQQQTLCPSSMDPERHSLCKDFTF